MSVARIRLRRRRTLIVASLAVGVTAVFILSMTLGSFALTPLQVVEALIGTSTQANVVFVVHELRLPRSVAAVLIGLALGASGTLFQRVLGNPLASPDFLGLSSTAGVGAVTALVLFGATGIGIALAAVAGAILGAVVIYLLAWQHGVLGYRFLLVGIGVAAVAESLTTYLVARAEFSDARAALTWLIGSVGMTTPLALWMLGGALVALAAIVPLLGRRLSALELGDDTAHAIGARPQADRLLLIAVAVLLVALATAAAGPIGFVALLAGPLSGLLLGRSGASIPAAALTGALIVQLCDLVAQYALPWPISTGVVTGFVGAPYIIWLLVSRNRRGLGA